jgi:glycosyltransferase involved in cell wall biosynthesis
MAGPVSVLSDTFLWARETTRLTMQRQRPRPLNRRPSASVVIPCYNYGHYLPTSVASALTQQGVDIEIVIVDDASPDNSVAVANELAATDRRIRVIDNKVNRGHIATYNTGLAAATGDYVVLLSADDLLAPNSIARAAALMDAYPEVAFVYGYSPRFTDQPPKARKKVCSWSIWAGDGWLQRICQRGSNVIASPEVVMRSTTMRELVGYDSRLPHAADLHLWMRAAMLGAVGRVNGCDQAFYRVHSHNMHLTTYAGLITDFVEKRRNFDYFFAREGMMLANAERLHQQAQRAMAREALTLAYSSLDRRSLSTAVDLVNFAEETFPPVRHERLWHAYQWRAKRERIGQGPSFAQRMNSLSIDIAGRLRWRRWRRYGL